MDLSDFNKDKQNFNHVSKDEQKVIVGKLQMLETLVDQLNCLRESYTRQLVVCGNNEESDVFQNEVAKEHKKEHKCVETLVDIDLSDSFKVV
mgnify:CR=1 FL=1|tara:strand:+ start:8984 stop:9259 length:276 start_codon:yes stop_codon:yes gene_type:complete